MSSRSPLSRAACLALTCLLSWGACAEEPLDAHWHEGSPNCGKRPGPALEVHRYDPHTLILREGLCSTPEAPFMYLLIGEQRAILIDSGDLDDARQINLVAALQQLLPDSPELGGKKPRLLVAHTHAHREHRAGDAQLRQLPGTEVVGNDLESVKSFYKLPNWPDGVGHLDLGQRALDVIPTPGHEATGVTFYDRGSALVFSGDFLLPGRIRVDDSGEYQDSVARLKSWLRDRPVTAFLGGHIEEDGQGHLFAPGSTYHPGERALPMTPSDLDGLSGALARFNGVYTVSSGFTVVSPLRLRVLTILASLIPLGAGLYLLRQRLPLRKRAAVQPAQAA